MSHFRLHTKGKERSGLLAGFAIVGLAAAVVFAVHSIGTVRAKSRETVLIYTEEELEQYLLDTASEEYNLNGKYRLEEDLDLGWLYQSIGTNLEPFTGSLDGNGHVVSGLTRPLFGVLEGAEVENLFLSGAEIEHPFTYYDGEHYVDGYGALAAYAVDTVIRNCGMNGEIRTASPSEAEYLLEKASPPEADEWKGPGMEMTERPGTGGELEIEEGPGIGGETVTDTETITETGTVIGTEIDVKTETDPEGGTEAESEPGSGAEPGGGTENGSKPGTGAEAGSGTESGSEPGSGVEPEGGSESGSKPGTGSEPGSGSESGTKPGTEAEPESGTESGTEPGTGAEPESGTLAGGTESQQQPADQEAGTNPSSAQPEEAIPPETIAYQPVIRQLLAMKAASMVAEDTVELQQAQQATPSDAEEREPSVSSLSNAEEAGEENSSETGIENNSEPQTTEKELQYTGSPLGDIYILVTADRVTAGGLIAESTGETVLINSFALVTIDSGLGALENYTGGLAGILGEGTRTENSYATGLSDSDGVNGGFAAVNEGSIINCYSTVTVGSAGSIRGAFTASGDGTFSGCVYDRQMACVEEEATAAAGYDARSR